MTKKADYSKTSIISDKASIGENTRIWQFCVIMDNVKIGNNCNIGQGCFIESGVVIGNGVTVKNNISLYTGVECEDDVFLGPNCVFTNVLNPRAFVKRKNEFKKTIIKKGASVGANATIVCGNTVGSYSMIGAGSVITHDVQDYAIVAGNPAKHIGNICKCGERLSEPGKADVSIISCLACGKRYSIKCTGSDFPTDFFVEPKED